MRIFRIQALDDRDLVGGTEETGVHAVEVHVLLAPRVQIAVQDLCRVMEREYLVARVRGEQRGGHRAHVAARRRQDRNRRRQRALAVAAHVVHRGDARNIPRIAVVQNLITHIEPRLHCSSTDSSHRRDHVPSTVRLPVPRWPLHRRVVDFPSRFQEIGEA